MQEYKYCVQIQIQIHTVNTQIQVLDIPSQPNPIKGSTENILQMKIQLHTNTTAMFEYKYTLQTYKYKEF